MRVVGDIEHDIAHTGEKCHQVDQLQAEHAKERGQRNETKQHRARYVRGQEERPAPYPVHQHATGQAAEQKGQLAGGDQEPHLERRCRERLRCNERQRQGGDLRAEQGGGQGSPDPAERATPRWHGIGDRCGSDQRATPDGRSALPVKHHLPVT